MSKPTLRLLAVLLTVGIVVVIFAGLDGLPRDLRATPSVLGRLPVGSAQLVSGASSARHDRAAWRRNQFLS